MMEQISADELRRRLPEILERVARGERFTIAEHGKITAELGPAEELSTAKAAVETILEIQNRVKPLGIPVRQAIEEGRV